TRRLIRYKVKPDRADENQRLIEAVFQELREKKPDGVRYMVLRMADDSFAHFVELEGDVNPLQGLESFRKFSGTAAERALEPPIATEAQVIGNYRMLGITCLTLRPLRNEPNSIACSPSSGQSCIAIARECPAR
ncbi:MAG: hypothetical protein JO237_08075, partial [Pseudolabrys sp.]|nr:hypothetical protein [Pseudolabrys sp.]